MNPKLENQAKKLQKQIRGKSQEQLAKELQSQLGNKFSELFCVLSLLGQYKYQRDLEDVEVVWSEGSTKLFSYNAADSDAPVVIFIPSLINRSYILDLSVKRSFLRYLRENNIASYLVDWGEPQSDEMDFCLDDYIARRLDSIIEHVVGKTDRKIFLAGYCMGGLMALACSLRNKDKIKGLALFATPWDFHVKDFARFKLDNQALEIVTGLINSSEKILPNIIQSMFYYLHPASVQHKFDNIASYLDGGNSKAMEEFVALESWVNDGISMTKRVGKECFIDWVHHNKIKEGQWSVAGNIVDPTEISFPTLFVVAKDDHIVPKSSSMALADIVVNKQVLTVDSGHISMIAGSRAKNIVWNPFINWIRVT